MTSFGKMDLYAEMEISKESTPEEIKKAYKKLAMVQVILTLEMASRQKCG